MGNISHDGEQRLLQAGKSVFDYADDLEVRVATSCGRSGTCHECVVEIASGMEGLRQRSDAESFLQDPFRLACQAVVENAEIDIDFSPLRRSPKILTSSAAKDVALAPVVSRCGDSVCYDGEVIDQYRGRIYGLAIDLGTTTVVMDLIDLESGESLRLSSFVNPQVFGGSDIMHRISYDGGRFHGELQLAIMSAVNREIRAMASALRFSRRHIYEVAVAGNSTMRDVFFGIDVQGIGQKPYKSITEHEYLSGARQTTSLKRIAREVGLKVNPQARVYGLPLIASHVGADTAACLLAVDMESQTDLVMVVDVGTNTEVVVGNKNKLFAASCPAGPAFEGGQVTYGMPGFEGAIESLEWTGSNWDYKVIGGVEPQGICGSGLIDLLAELRRHGLMTEKGVFTDGSAELEIVPQHGITFSRSDGSNLAQAKAANYCGQLITMRTFGVDPENISRVFLAGGFANYVDPRNAIDIGFLAPVPEERIVKVGNAAVQGVREALLSRSRREIVERMVTTIEHIELETTPDFFELFVDGCQIKPMPDKFNDGAGSGKRSA